MLPQIWKDVLESGFHYLNNNLTTEWQKRKQFLEYCQSLQQVLHATKVEIPEWSELKNALINTIMVSYYGFVKPPQAHTNLQISESMPVSDAIWENAWTDASNLPSSAIRSTTPSENSCIRKAVTESWESLKVKPGQQEQSTTCETQSSASTSMSTSSQSGTSATSTLYTLVQPTGSDRHADVQDSTTIDLSELLSNESTRTALKEEDGKFCYIWRRMGDTSKKSILHMSPEIGTTVMAVSLYVVTDKGLKTMLDMKAPVEKDSPEIASANALANKVQKMMILNPRSVSNIEPQSHQWDDHPPRYGSSRWASKRRRQY